ncbi:MAG: YegS/Rv2252/BmrU family lipid kinase [Pirellulaceae bacterium]
MPETCLLFNAAAGSAAAAEPLVREFLQRNDVEFHATSGPGDIPKFTHSAVERGLRRLIVAGGDGTITKVITSLAPDFGQVELAIVPLGTGNDFARSLSIDAADIASALENATFGAARPVDLVRITDEAGTGYLINAASGGVAGKVAAEVDSDDKQVLGPFAYWLAAVNELTDLQEYRVSLDLDDEHVQLDVYGMYFANGRYVGGGFTVAPDALLDDGLLDITTIPAMPPVELLAAGMSFALGWDDGRARLRTFRTRRVHFLAEPDMHFSVDGEPTRAIEASLEVLPGAARIVPGPAAEAFSSDASNRS